MLHYSTSRTYGRLSTTAAALSLLGAAVGCGDDSSAGPGAPAPEIPAEFAPVCSQATAQCHVELTPPNLVGSYAGTGETVVTTSELWGVGNSEDFTATITSVAGGTVTGSFQMETFELVVEAAEIRGSGAAFTIYGIDAVDVDGCSLEARAVITGTIDEAAAPSTITGELTLVFTENITGAACTPEQLADYPGTGASFSYTATRGI